MEALFYIVLIIAIIALIIKNPLIAVCVVLLLWTIVESVKYLWEDFMIILRRKKR